MTERERQLMETRRSEALALFQANQAGRTAGGQVAALVLTVIGLAVAAGINAHTDVIALAIPPIALILISFMFQQYADVTVTGAARAVLEQCVAKELGAHALIYEYAVAPIRQRPPYSTSMGILKGAIVLAVLTMVGVGIFAATQHRPWYLVVGFAIGTGIGLLSAAASFRDMKRVGEFARREIEQAVNAPV